MERAITPMTLPLPARREYLTSEAALRGLRCAEARYPAGMRIPHHVHERASITVVTGGGLVERRWRAKDSANCGAGMLLLRPAGEPHANDIGGAGAINVELDIAPELLRECELAIASATARAHAEIGQLAARLGRAMREQGRARSLLVEGLALEILGLALQTPSSSGSRGKVPPRWLARVHERIVAEHRSDLGVGELAREVGTHPVYLARQFRAYYGQSPAELLRACRLAWAARELEKDDGRSIASIAIDAGYYDESHFARAFRACYRQSPASYRRGRASGR